MGYNIGEIYQSNSDFLKADDIGQNFWTVSISNVDMKSFDDGSRKLMVQFHELDKSLVLNKTNADMIGDLYGKDTDGWFGKQIMLFTAPVDYQGKKVQAIRVRGPAASMQAAPQPRPSQQIAQTSPQRPLNPSPQQQNYGDVSGGNPAGPREFAPVDDLDF